MTGQVFREIAVDWRGETYHFTPSARLLRRIESEGVLLLDVLEGISVARPAISHVAFIISVFLRSAGADKEVSEEAIMQMFLRDVSGKLLTEATVILMAALGIAPGSIEVDAKNPEAPVNEATGAI